jgi:hypothetical protein
MTHAPTLLLVLLPLAAFITLAKGNDGLTLLQDVNAIADALADREKVKELTIKKDTAAAYDSPPRKPVEVTLGETDSAPSKSSSQTALEGQDRLSILASEYEPLTAASSRGGFHAEVLYVSIMTMTALALTGIFIERGLANCLAIICNVLALSIMSLLIRHIYVDANFRYPQFVTFTHAVFTMFVGSSVLIHRWVKTGDAPNVPDIRTFMLGVVPIGAAFALSLSFANMALLYTNAHYYEMIGSSGFLITAGVGLLMGKPFSFVLLPPMLCITTGAIVLAVGELHFSLLGTVLILSANMCRAIKAQLQGSLMSKDGKAWNLMVLDPLELVVATSFVIACIMAGWSMAAEGSTPLSRVVELDTFIALLPAAINASILNIAGLFVLRSVGPVAQQCIGQLKGVLCCLGSVAAFSEVITSQQIVGYSFVVFGIFWYNHSDIRLKALAPSKEKNASTPLLANGALQK